MRVVLDTGIFVSALITTGTPPDMLYRAWRKGLFELITSTEQIEELSHVLGYKKLQKYISPKNASILLDTIHAVSMVQKSIPYVELSPDPDDNKIIATAIAGEADYLVTGDKKDLLSLESADGIPIITARQAVEILNLQY